jgi:hypothetical protein
MVSSVTAQTKSAENMKQQFQESQVHHLHEKIFVHTDKSIYLAGELVWFKLYYTDGYQNNPLNFSKISYVEIFSAAQQPVLQAKIMLNSGTGSGSFLIPPSLNSGNYLLRAYTNWMKNFPAEQYFEKQLTIINSQKRPDWRPETAAAYDFQLFPEGGNLVAGLSSNVGFRVTARGRGLHCTGAVVNQRNDTVAVFTSSRLGIGRFTFMPQPGDKYTASVSLNDTTIARDLPTIYNDGYVMNLAASENNQLKIIVHSRNKSSRSPVYLLVHRKQSVTIALMQILESEKAVFLVEKKDLPDGISNFLLLDAAGQPLCERLYFKRPQKKLLFEVIPDRQQYSTQEKVMIQLNSYGDSSRPLIADLSVSVFLVDSLQRFEEGDIFSHLWLSSELKGGIESPAEYFVNDGAEAEQAIDNLMLTHGWRRFDWNATVTNSQPSFRFLPEYEGHIVNGKLVNKRTGVPKSDVAAFLSIPGERFQYSNSTSGKEGDVRFIVRDFFGTEDLIVQTNLKMDTGYRIDISSPFSEEKPSRTLLPFDLSETLRNDLVIRSIGVQAQNRYLSDSMQQFYIPKISDTTSFFGKPDKEYMLDDYTRFVTMEEVMREFVTEVRLKKRQQSFQFEVLNHPYNTFFENDPLVLLDGVPVFDFDKIVSFDPLKIKKIDIVSQRYYHGRMVNYGIVSYKTYEGDLAGFQLDPASLVVEYEGLQLKRRFYSPLYENTDGDRYRLPDFRNVLYWSPDIITDEKGKAQFSFYTSELPGTYAVVLCGVTADGHSGSSVTTFSVRPGK